MKKPFDVLRYRYIAMGASGLLIAVGIVLFFVLGFNAGIDFASGYSERFQIAENHRRIDRKNYAFIGTNLTESYPGKPGTLPEPVESRGIHNGKMGVLCVDGHAVQVNPFSYTEEYTKYWIPTLYNSK